MARINANTSDAADTVGYETQLVDDAMADIERDDKRWQSGTA